MSGAMQFVIRLNVDGAAAAVTAVTNVGDAAQGAAAKTRAAGEAATAAGLAQAKAVEDLRLAYDDGYAAQSRFAAAQQQVIDLFQAGAINARQLEMYLGRVAAAYDPVAAKTRDEAAALAALEARLDPVSAKTRQLAADQAALDAALAKGQITAARHGELTAGIRGQQAALAGAQGAVKDYGRALQALGPQVADVGVTLAMGMNPLMVAVQQGPQIIEMLAMAGAGARAAAASFLALAAPVVLVGGALALATTRAAGNAQALREFDVQLRATGQTGKATAAELQAVAKELYALGASKDEAAAAVNAALASRKFTSADQIREIGALAIDASAGLRGLVTGFDDAGAAAKTLTDWLGGGVKGLREASDATGALTAQQYEAARAAYEAGDKARAQSILTEALRGRYQGLARDGLSPAAAAMRDVSRAWDELLDVAANNQITLSINIVGGEALRGATTWLKDFAAFLDNPTPGMFGWWQRGNPMFGGLIGGPNQPPPPVAPPSAKPLANRNGGAGTFRGVRGGGDALSGADIAAMDAAKKANDDLAAAYKKTGQARQIALAGVAAYNQAVADGKSPAAALVLQAEAERKARIEATGAIADQSAALKAYSRAAAEGAAAVLGGAAEEMVYWKALSAAMQDAVTSGADPYAAAARELAKQAADAAMAGAAQVKEMEAATAATAAQADAALVNAAAEEQAALGVKIYNETLAERSLLQYADADAAGALAEVIARKIAALEGEATAQKRLDLARDIRGQRDQLTVMQAEIRLMGAGAAARAVEMARIKALIDLKNKNIDTSSREAQEYLANAEALAKTGVDLERIQAAYQELGDFGEKAFDAVIDKMTEAGDKGLRLKDIATAIGAEFQTLALKMTLINPAKNWMTGGNLPTVYDLFSGGGGAQAAAGQGGGLGSTGNLLSLGSKFMPSSWTSGITSAIDTWGATTLGIGSAATMPATIAVGANGMLAGGGATSIVPGQVAAGTGLSAYLGSAGIGALGGFLGGMLGTAANSKAVGALSGAALGAGGAGLASYLGFSAAGGPVGLAIGALAGALTGALGTSKKPKTEASAYANMTEGGVITGADTGSRYQDAGPVIAARDAVTASVQALVTAGATFDGVSVNIRAMGDNWETRSQGLDGYKVSTSDDPATIVRDYIRWAASDASNVLGKDRPALGLSDIGRRAAASATTTGEDYIATIALAEQVAAGAAALQDFDKSLGGITAAAKKAAAEGFAPLAAELAKASDGGFAGEYRALVAGQMRQMLDQMAAPVEYSALEQAMASAAGEMAALRQASVDLGLGLEGAVDAAAAAVKSRLLSQANDEIAAAIDEASGRGYRNSARDIQAEFGATARTLAALGGDGARALDLAGAKLTALLGGLDEAAALDAVSLLTGDLAALGVEALAAARASQTAAAAQEAAARAAETQARAVEINEDLQIRLLRAGGDAAAADALAAALTRSREAAEFAAAGYDAATLALLAQVQAAEASATATAQAAALTGEATTSALQRRKDADTLYISSLGDIAAAARSAVSSLRSVASSLRDLPGRLALDKDLSILDPRGRLDEAWRQIGAALNDALGGERLGPDVLTRARGGEASAAAQIDAALRAGVVSADAAARVEALIQAALTAGRDYYADLPAYSADYQYLTGLADSLAAAAESSAAGLDSEAAAIDRQIVALGGAAAATERSITSMGDLRGAVEAAAAAWATGKTAGANDNAQEAILRAAMAQSGYRYEQDFGGGRWADWLTNTMAASPQKFGDDPTKRLQDQAIAAVTGFKGDFGEGRALTYVQSDAISELQREAAREVIRRFGGVPTFSTGGDLTGGTPGVDSLLMLAQPGEKVLRPDHAQMLDDLALAAARPAALTVAVDLAPVTAAISAGASATIRAIDASAGRIVGAVDGLSGEIARLNRVIADQGREIARLTAIVGRLAA